MPIRVALMDAHPLVLDALARRFTADEGFAVVSRSTRVEAALEAVRRHRPDVLVLDPLSPGRAGLELLRQLRREGTAPHTVVLTADMDAAQLVEALRLGVRGVVLKGMAPELLLRCVRKVAAGETWLEHHSTEKLLARLLEREAGSREATRLLTPRELEVVLAAVEGLRNRQIAKRLGVSNATVKTHLHNLYRKLSVRSRFELLRWAESRGLTGR